jgi:PAS domain S-box-containing protein
MTTLVPDPETLLDAAIELSRRPLDETLPLLVERLRVLLGADTTSAIVWDETCSVGRVRAASGLVPERVGELSSVPGSLPRRALAAGAPQFGDTLATGFTGPVSEQLRDLRSAVSVPVLGGDRPLTLQAAWVEEQSPETLETAAATLTRLAALTGLDRRAERGPSPGDDRVLLDAIFDAAADGIVIERDGRWIQNRAGQRINGAPDERAPSFAELNVRRLDGTPLASPDELEPRHRVRMTTLKGDEIVVEGSYSREPVPVIVFRDVTEQHLRETETAEYLRSLLDTIPTPICVVEKDTRRVLSTNRAFLALVGLTEEQVVGALHPYPWWSEGEHSLPASDEPYPRIFRRADGTPVPVEIDLHDLRDGNGNVYAYIGVITDLSERRRFQQQLLQSGKLAAIGELAAGVAHEVNNPLFAILGLVEFLLKDSEPGTKAHDRLQLIQSTALEIKEIVRSLLDFARESSNERAVVGLDQVVRETVTLVSRTTAGHGVEMVEEFGEGPFLVEASPNQLKQVFLNLIGNARQAMPNGGTIRIALSADDDAVEAVVADTGEGIAPEHLQRIFEPFYTTKRDRGGTGLGLSVSVGIAETHGGSLTAASTPGAGAAFTLRLPRHA